MQGQCMTKSGIGVLVGLRQRPRPYPAISEPRWADDSGANGVAGLYRLAELFGLTRLDLWMCFFCGWKG
jgi:hypothetical protein